MVDARGVEIPYLDRDGNELKDVRDRFHPAKGQKFFLKGGVIDEAKYEYRGPETMPFEELDKRGYKLPFYADLSRMPGSLMLSATVLVSLPGITSLRIQ